MGLRDAAEQLEACKADAVRYEHRIAELEQHVRNIRGLWHEYQSGTHRPATVAAAIWAELDGADSGPRS